MKTIAITVALLVYQTNYFEVAFGIFELYLEDVGDMGLSFSSITNDGSAVFLRSRLID
jgi:hypothetical protein